MKKFARENYFFCNAKIASAASFFTAASECLSNGSMDEMWLLLPSEAMARMASRTTFRVGLWSSGNNYLKFAKS